MKPSALVSVAASVTPPLRVGRRGLRIPTPRGVDLDAGLRHCVVLVGDVDVERVGLSGWRSQIVRVPDADQLRSAMPPSTLAAVCVAASDSDATTADQLDSLARACPGAVLHALRPEPQRPPSRAGIAELVSAAYYRRLTEAARFEVATRPFGLAQRECVLLALYWFGVPRRELARVMNVADSTVASLVRRILLKAEAESLAHLAQRMRSAHP